MPVHEWGSTDADVPGLLLLQEIFGVSGYIRQRAADLAALGYYVIAPEIYWRLDDTSLDESDPQVMQRAMSIAGRLDWDQAVKDAVAALDYLRERGKPTGIVGFCFGGGLAFNVAAESSPDVVVSYYGSALPRLLDLAPNVNAACLHHFGTPTRSSTPRRSCRHWVVPRSTCTTEPVTPSTTRCPPFITPAPPSSRGAVPLTFLPVTFQPPKDEHEPV